jgi:(1->4)-alpha-D-glucan 1-alpha-D-glucosylmutase
VNALEKSLPPAARASNPVEGEAASPTTADSPALNALAETLFRRAREEVLAQAQTPLATYRVQFHKGFSFDDARRVVPYLARLGISDLYASPYLAASPGSTHGYDVVDHSRLNPEVGTPEQHAALAESLREVGLGQVLDVVPNHMGIETFNPLWFDVLENGPA